MLYFLMEGLVMLIQNTDKNFPCSSEVTPKDNYLNRRKFMLGVGAIMMGTAIANPYQAYAGKTLNARHTTHGKGLSPTSFEHVASYNNFYEFSLDKLQVKKTAENFKPRPWSVRIDGEVNKPATISFEDLIRFHKLEERIYRFRCVEAWSMVVPWVGISLAQALRRFEPTSRAKYVAFETLYDPQQMPNQKKLTSSINWPYREGLRIDEAMHPLTLLTVGMYGEVLPNQNGAPVRLIVPWKYGFKSIKSIVRIHFTEHMPYTSWNALQANEYGFYANVNPDVDHPRWSQKKERPIGSGFFTPRKKTLMFNGYADHVADLYAGMDLTKLF